MTKRSRPGAARRRDGGTHAVVRRAAIDMLLASSTSGCFIDEVVAAGLAAFEERDRHLLQEITYGTVRHRNTLDHLLDFHLKLPVDRQREVIAWALRVGAYQLVYLDRVPPHAAVNQTLEGLKTFEGVGPRDVGFANAVLHKLAAEIRHKSPETPVDAHDPTVLPIRSGHCHFARPVLPLYRMETVKHIALKHSHPAWLVARWLERHGEEETERLCEAQNRIPLVTARVTRLAPSRQALLETLAQEGFSAEAGSLENSIVLRQAGGLERSEALARGWLQVQDETAIRIGAALSPPRGARVLDLCAAPGGKASQLLEDVGPGGHVVAADRSVERLALVRENLSRFGANFSTVLVPEKPEEISLGETFSHVLVDAPCSNTGVLARRPEARWRLRKADLESLAAFEAGLIEAGLRHLAPGGRLVYATCSIEPEENENVVAQAVKAHPELTEIETQLFLPHRVGADGGFYSLLLKGRG